MTRKIALIFYILFAAVPVVCGLFYAIFYSLGLTGILSDGLTLSHWEQTLSSSTFYKSIGYSLFIALVVMTISIVLALWITISWLQDLKKGILSYMIYLPLAFPAIVMAFFSFQLLSKSGFLSRVAHSMGVINQLQQFPDWINDAYGVGIIFSLCLLITPFFIILFSNLYHNERIPALAHLAATLGASQNQIVWRVVIPVLLKKSAFTIFLFVLFVMGTYEIPLLLGRQDPSMLSVLIIQKLQKFNLADIPQAYTMAVIYVIIIGTVVAILFYGKPQFFKNSAQ